MKPIFCDNHILILEKPAGIATQPQFHEMAKAWVKKEFKKPGNVFLEPIHRLDKPVSGLILFARTSKALSRLNEAMRNKQIKKTYLAKVEGEVMSHGTLVHHLIHGDFRAHIDPTGKEAVLHFKKLSMDGKNSLIEVDLETGRYHQIRIQFAEIGHPVVGDEKYGASSKHKNIALHHQKFTIPHPITKEMITFVSQAVLSF